MLAAGCGSGAEDASRGGGTSGTDEAGAGAAGSSGAWGGAGGSSGGGGAATGGSGGTGGGAAGGSGGAASGGTGATSGAGGTGGAASGGTGAAGGGPSGGAGGVASGGTGGIGGSTGTGDGKCEPGYDSGVWDPYPGNNESYPKGKPSTTLPWAGENFESYADGALIETSSAKSMRTHLDVTSGSLYANYVGAYHRGWTTTYNFRVLAVGLSGGKRIRWTDQTASYRGYLWNWHSSASSTNGLHLFARYQTENDLYVASLRYDGLVTLKKKHCGAYTTLAQKSFGTPALKTWYTLELSAVGTSLGLKINGIVVLTAQDPTFSWGTTGIRTDYADVYFDDWKLVY